MWTVAKFDKGDLDGYAVWRRMLRAVEELQGTAPKSVEAGHGQGFPTPAGSPTAGSPVRPGGLPESCGLGLSDGVPHGLRCPASPAPRAPGRKPQP